MAHIANRNLRVTIFEGFATMIFAYGVGCASLSCKDIATPPDALLFSISLLIGLALCGEITDGHLNPMISISALIYKGSKSIYVNILGQLMGAFLGVLLFWLITGKTAYPAPNTKDGIFKFCLNELVGSFFFSICVLAVTNPRTTYTNKSWQMYLAISVCLFLTRKMTGETYLNPALGVAHQMFSAIFDHEHAKIYMIVILIVPSIIGGIVAGFVMKYCYEPMLLYSRFKDDLESEDHNQQRSQ